MFKRRLLLTLLTILLAVLSLLPQSDASRAQSSRIPAPEDVLGFKPGDDRKLAGWAKVIEYFQRLSAASDRVKFEEIGKSTMGAPFVYATISAPENLKRLDEFKEIQRQLADPRILGSPTNPAVADRKADQLIARGKTVVAITCGIHSTEVGSYLSSMLIAYRLASSNEPEIQEILKNTIILLVPSTNPDGVDIVNNWYQKTLGTPYEGTDPPELYHHYTGHDDNRDWYAFTQVETQLVVDQILNVWHPQIVHDIHQQGAYGSRLFLPPYMKPVEPNVPKQIVEGYTELGNYLAKEMRAAGFKGITTDSTYDAWSPSRAYSHYHGGVRILQETASCRLATPITVKFEQLRPGEGYDPQKESANFGPLWRGGEWHIRDITNTMTTVAFFLLKHAAQNREHWLERFYEIEKEAVRLRKAGEIDGYKITMNESADWILDILDRADVGYAWLKEGTRVTIKATQVFNTAESTYPSPTVYVPIAQPYGSFAKAVLESQHYPDLRDSGGRPIPPYDVTAHSLPLLINVQVAQVVAPYSPVWVKKARIEHGIGDCMLTGRKSIALYKSAVPSIDEGWTKWVFKRSSCAEFEEITDAEIRSGSFDQKYRIQPEMARLMSAEVRATRYRTIIIPDQPRAAILNGHRKGTMPDEYTGGLGAEGVKALREFVEAGGTLVCLNRASDFAIEQFKLPVRDVVDGLPRTDFYVPGSILRIELDTNDPIAKGMPKESIAWVENSPVFEVIQATLRLPNQPPIMSNIHVIAWYPRDKDPLLSGWLLGGERIKGKAALVEVTMGKGRIILFGFRPQYRGQSLATYPLFFNAISGK
jgi:Zinc carboxypeptidase